MIKVSEHASFEEALATFKTESKSVLLDAGRHKSFSPDRSKKHSRAKSAGGGNRQRNGRKPRVKR